MPAFYSQGCVLLTQHLEKRDMEQKDFAQIAEIDAAFLNHLLRGRKRPSLDTAVKLQDASGIEPAAWTMTPAVWKAQQAKQARRERRRLQPRRSA